MSILNFIASQIFGQPAILFGLIALLGLVLQKKPIEDIIKGTTKTIIGFVVLIGGVNLLKEATDPLGGWIKQAIGVQGVIPNNFLVMAKSMESFGREIGIAVLIGFTINLLLARFTKYKYVSITGHVMVIVASFAVAILAPTTTSKGTLMVVAGIFCGFYYWIVPLIIHQCMRKNDRLPNEWSLFVSDATGVLFGSLLGKWFGNKDKRCDNLKLPKSLEWIKDTTVSVAVIAAIFWMALGIITGKDIVMSSANGQNWIVYLVMLGIKFSGGLSVVIFGVGMLIDEIIPAFKGISEKLIKGCIPGLDYPTLFNYAPLAVVLGFIFNLLGGILATVVMVAFKMPTVVLPAIFMNFWSGAIIGVFADVYGGRRGVIVASLLLGFLVPFAWAIGYPMSGALNGAGVVLDYTDASTFGLALQFIGKLLGR